MSAGPAGAARNTILDREDDIALVLMDVMMPEPDGYATATAKSIASGACEYEGGG